MDVRHEAEFTALRRILELSRGTSSFTTAVCNSPAFRETLFVESRDGGIAFTHAAVVAGSLDPVEEVRAQIPTGATDAVFITGLDYLLAQGQNDEAIRILRDEELPIHERLGIQHKATGCRARLAFALHRRSRGDDARVAFQIMSECHRTARSQGWPEARQFEAILLNWGVPKEWLKTP